MGNRGTPLPFLLILPTLVMTGCVGDEPTGIFPSQGAATTVVMDFYHKPLPLIPLPNDVATRHDPVSPTGRRINASMVAPIQFERRTREMIDQLDGWGVFQPITIPFSGPLDVESILKGHRDEDYDLTNDVVYLINVDPRSKRLGRIYHLDVGNGNYPVVLEDLDAYWKNDPRRGNLSLWFEEEDEDKNGNGKLDPGEDTDADGILDKPNYLPGRHPARDDLAGRADALMTFYDSQSNTLILRTLLPLDERTTYAVVVTRRLKDARGRSVGSPYAYVNHASQTPDLVLLPHLLPPGLKLSDVAFAFTFTTQSIQSHWRAVRDGLYGHGIQAHLADQFPARIAALDKLRDPKVFTKMKNPHLLYSENLADIFHKLVAQLLNYGEGSATISLLFESTKYVDYFVVGSFNSPQLFPRREDDKDPASKLLDLNRQSWPPDLDRVPVTARGEEVHFWISVPRKEVSARGKGQPAPVVIFDHGYGGSRIEMLGTAGLFALNGVAVIAFDHPSHGPTASKIERTLAEALAEPEGLKPTVNALLKGRTFDQNHDGTDDSGADFFSSYLFHTRDMLRQTVLDHMQAIRILRSFDGKRRWAFDVDGNGQPELAGDFDADGAVDVGGQAPITTSGVSLGGMVSLMVASLDPEIRTTAPFAGAAGLPDIGIRSLHAGVAEAFMLRVMGPLYVGTLDPTSGQMKLETVVVDLNKAATREIGTVEGVRAGDALLVENLENGERGCGYVSSEGLVRAAVKSDLGDRTRLLFYAKGEVSFGEGCVLEGTASPYEVVETFKGRVFFQDQSYEGGDPLVALAEGMGYQRGTQRFRRFSNLASLVLDPGDMVSVLRHLQLEPLTYPGTGQTTGAHALIINTIGDMSVPTSTGITACRAAGLIDFLRIDPRFGRPVNQVLLDTHTAEAVHTLGRYTSKASGSGVHMDVDNLSEGNDMWAGDVPRLVPPLRIGVGVRDRRGGVSAALFPYSSPEGIHVARDPGQMIDQAREACRSTCTEETGDDPCGCNSVTTFDTGVFMFNVIARYLSAGGKTLTLDTCNATHTCTDVPPPPPARDKSTLF